MINTKIIAVFAGFAFLVSLIVGGIRGVTFFDLILRTIIWSFVFAAIGLGISVISNRFFPELNQMLNGENVEEKSYKGDFEAVIPEENPHDSSNQDMLFSDMNEDTQIDLETGDEESSEVEELGDAENIDEEIQEDQPLEAEQNTDDISNIDEISDTEQPPEDDIDNLDVLPEIETLTSSFTPFSGGDEGGGAILDNDSIESKSMYSKPKTNMDVGSFVEDPEKTAKAIHTWIERDKEG